MTAHMPQSPQQKSRTKGGDAQGRGAREAASPKRATRRWGVILAGGDGIRLRRLARFVCGDDRPKQFCPLLGTRTLLQEARQRAERSISSDQILYSLTGSHQAYYLRELGDRPSQRVVQPCNKGTAPAILYSLLQISRRDPDAIVAVLPCDHYYSQERAFTAAFESAFAAAEARPGSIVLLGAQPTAPEVGYGWIDVGDLIGTHPRVFLVNGFQEKPSLSIAEHLLRIGSLWNTFVMVGHIGAFLDLALESVPALLQALRVRVISTSNSEIRIPEWLYDRIDPADFSRTVLSPGAKRLVALHLSEVEWNDLGDPDRVISTLLESGIELPGWATRWRAEREAERGTAQKMSVAFA